MERRLLDINGLSESLGKDAFPVRMIRSLKDRGVIPYLKLGHRTLRFDIEKVLRALKRFEVHEIGAQRSPLNQRGEARPKI